MAVTADLGHCMGFNGVRILTMQARPEFKEVAFHLQTVQPGWW